jgi:hypothetical protein
MKKGNFRIWVILCLIGIVFLFLYAGNVAANGNDDTVAVTGRSVPLSPGWDIFNERLSSAASERTATATPTATPVFNWLCPREPTMSSLASASADLEPAIRQEGLPTAAPFPTGPGSDLQSRFIHSGCRKLPALVSGNRS